MFTTDLKGSQTIEIDCPWMRTLIGACNQSNDLHGQRAIGWRLLAFNHLDVFDGFILL